MKPIQIIAGVVLGAVLLGGGWVTVFHAEWIKPQAKEEDDEKVETEVPVHVGKVTKVSFHRYVEGYGNVAPEPAHDGAPPASARVASPSTGVLSESRCAEGQKVERGAVLFQLDTRMATAEAQKAAAARVSAKATLERMTAAVDFAESELARTKKLATAKLASDKDLATAELQLTSSKKEQGEAAAKVAEADRAAQAAQTQAALLRIQSPLAGTVVKVNVNPGEAVEASTVLAEVVDLDRLIVAATIPAAELRFLKMGQEVEIQVGERAPAAAAKDDDDKKKDDDDKKPAADKKDDDKKPAADKKDDEKKDDEKKDDDAPPVYAGKVAFLGFQVDMRSDTVPVRISIPKNAGLRPGQYVRVRVVVEEHEDKLGVPIESLVRGEDGPVVSLVDGDKAVQKSVKAGLKEGGLVEVEGEGLREGIQVVTAGAYGLPKETKIRVITP